MAESTVTKSAVFKEDIAIANGGTGAEEIGTRLTSTGAEVTLTKLDTTHFPFRSIDNNPDGLVDGDQDIEIKPSSITMNGTLTNEDETVAGFVKVSAAGVYSGGHEIATSDLPTAIDATKIADGSVSNTEFQYLNGVTSSIQTQFDSISKSTVQIAELQTGAVATGTTVLPNDDTKPGAAEGDEYMSLAITPTSTDNYLLVNVVWHGSVANPANMICVALHCATIDADYAVAASFGFNPNNPQPVCIAFNYYVKAPSTSEITFTVRAGPSGADTMTFNGFSGGRIFGGVIASSIIITEIAF